MSDERFIGRSGQGVIRRTSSALGIEDMQRIMVEVDRGVPPEQSKVRPSVEARQFREQVSREIAKAKSHPKYKLHFTPEMPEL